MTVKAWDLCVGDIIYREFVDDFVDTWMVMQISEGQKHPKYSFRRMKFYHLNKNSCTEAEYESKEVMPHYSAIHVSNKIPV